MRLKRGPGAVLRARSKRRRGIPEPVKEALESPQIPKIMFDCRSTADSLHHQHGVTVDSVEDMQLMAYMAEYRRLESGHPLPTFLRTMQPRYGNGIVALFQAAKPNLPTYGDFGCPEWNRRPLPRKILDYCALQMSFYFDLYNILIQRSSVHLTCLAPLEDVREWSRRYVEQTIHAAGDGLSRRKNLDYLPYGVIVPPPGPPERACVDCEVALPDTELDNRGSCTICRKMFR